jgi:predicted MPP superfamily phosphohydrolase
LRLKNKIIIEDRELFNRIKIRTYTISSPPAVRGLYAALVTDIHERDPGDILSILRSEQSDVIFVAGDLIEAKRALSVPHWRTPKRALAFLSGASEIAPVYYSPGNHEIFLPASAIDDISKTGAVFLANTDTVASINGRHLLIGGITSKPDTAWLSQFASKSGYKILLCHHPEYYPRYIAETGIDLTLSGHTHGGQWRVFGRGIYSPGQGLFPKYTRGIYENRRLVVSAGASNHEPVPRINNPLEVVFIKFG